MITLKPDSPPQTVLSLLNRHAHFSSIEAPAQSVSLGKYFFITTEQKYEKAKEFITDTLPEIGSRLDNTFLDELPPSVQCPRLTTSDLKELTTTRTAALLASKKMPDAAAAASQWSKPPQANQQPP
jgi:hypothetical protein